MSDLVFVGDVALSDENSICFRDVPTDLKKQIWIGNLEGAILAKAEENTIYNNENGFSKYLEQLPLHIACLANNHITDIGSITETKKFLKSKDILYLGAGSNLQEAMKPLVTDKIVFLNFGWSAIQCVAATADKAGVNELKREHVLKQFRRVKKKYPQKRLIPIFHWNYELELYPMPRQRELAKQLIDLGAEIIIGHHSHLLQGVEVYQGKYIVHGLGNWAFKPRSFKTNQPNSPTDSSLQAAFAYSLETGEGRLNFFEYDSAKNIISYLGTEAVTGKINKELTPYANLNQKEYKIFFRKNRLKRKLLPIYYASDSDFTVGMKNLFLKFRDIGISLLN